MTYGFNSNVRAGEIVYHVQTEQRGADGAVIDTVVYISGRVIHRVQSNLRDAQTDAAAGPDPLLDASERVHRQHQSVIAQLESGALRPASVPRSAK
jgi:hypothetical protein